MKIGRRSPVDVWLPRASVSRHHCTITNRSGALELTDHASNPTILNGQPVDGATPLAANDILQLGDFHLRLEIQQEDSLLFSRIISEDDLLDELSGEDALAAMVAAPRLSTGRLKAVSPHVGQMIAGYEIRYPIGEGATSEVFLAYDPVEKTRVAIKIFHSTPRPNKRQVERFRREARVAEQLKHPRIVNLLGSGEQDGALYLICEFLEGRTLAALLKVVQQLRPQGALEIAHQLADALAYASDLHIVHRDVNPRNVFVRTENRKLRVKLIDFGLAKQAGDTQLTRPGEGFGTLGYMAPEQLQRASAADLRSDIYGVGAVTYRMIAGRVHKCAQTASAMLEEVQRDTPSLKLVAPDCPTIVARLVDRCLAVDPAQRFQTYPELLREMALAQKVFESPVGLDR